MNPADKKRAEMAFVRGLPNFAEIRAARARELHFPSDVVGYFTEEFIVMTPMNLHPPVSYMMLSKYDYVQEYGKLLNGGATWDDTSSNKARVGDLFGFVFYQPSQNNDKMEIFRVVDILGAEHRRPNWIIAEHADRKVLVLSNYLGKVRYSAFAAAKGYKLVNNERHYSFVRGTRRSEWPKELGVDLQGKMKEEPDKKEETEEKMEDEVVE